MTLTSRILAALALSVTLLGSAAAGSLDIVINGKSHHINSRYDWNEDNLGLGLEYEFDSRSRWVRTLHANSFRDSLENMCHMAGAGLKRRLFETDRLGGLHFDAGVVAFLMSRKDINDSRPFPGILPAVTLGNRYGGVNLTYLPKMAVHDIARADVVDPTIGGILFLQFKLRMSWSDD